MEHCAMESSHCFRYGLVRRCRRRRQIMKEFTRNSSSLLFNAAVNTNESSHNVTHSSSLVQHFVVCCLKCKWATEQCYNLNKIGIFNFFLFFFRSFSTTTSSLIGELRLKIPFLLLVPLRLLFHSWCLFSRSFIRSLARSSVYKFSFNRRLLCDCFRFVRDLIVESRGNSN